MNVTFIDNQWEFQTVHLGLKLAAWNHAGVLLARPVARYLIKHGLYHKMSFFLFFFTNTTSNLHPDIFSVIYMLAQTTDSGSNNHTLAFELQRLFLDANPSVSWSAGLMQIRCYAHKLALLVKHGLASIGLNAGHTKPTTQPLFNIPTPSIILNDGDDVQHEVQDESEDSDHSSESENGHCDSESDDEIDRQPPNLPSVLPGSSRSRPDLVVQAIKKVSSSFQCHLPDIWD
jgi:hypothetical protein